MENQFDPAEALATAQGARERLAARAKTPAWYGIIYGFVCGAIVAGGALPRPLGSLFSVLGITGAIVLYTSWQKATGLSVNGFRAGQTRIIAIILGILLVALIVGGLILRTRYGLEWAPWAAGAIAIPASMLLSMAWDRAWRREILGGAQ